MQETLCTGGGRTEKQLWVFCTFYFLFFVEKKISAQGDYLKTEKKKKQKNTRTQVVEQNKGLNIQRMMKLMMIQHKKNQEMNIGFFFFWVGQWTFNVICDVISFQISRR